MLIGVMMPDDTPYYSTMHRAFAEELKRLTPPGQHIKIILQRPFPDPIALSNTARKLIAADVNLIVAYGSPATLAVIHERTDIPLVYAGFYNPGPTAVHGRNVTGCGFKVPLTSILRYLRSLKPISTLSVIYSSLEEDSTRQADELQNLARDQHIHLVKINIKSRRDIKKLDFTMDDGAFFYNRQRHRQLVHRRYHPYLTGKKVPVSRYFSRSNGSRHNPYAVPASCRTG